METFRKLNFSTILFLIIVIFLTQSGCQTKKEDSRSEDYALSEDVDTVSTNKDFYATKDDWDYQKLYGVYHHESNTKGFNAVLEIRPEGNDLTFSLSVSKQSCTTQIDGSIGIAFHSEKEYAGFYDNPDCRMEVMFYLKSNSIRIQEIGFCTLHEGGCSFTGIYVMKK